MKQFYEEETRYPTVEVFERVDVQEAAFGIGQVFDYAFVGGLSPRGHSCRDIVGEIAHQHRYLPVRRRDVRTHPHVANAPTPSDLRRQIVTNAPMELQQEFVNAHVAKRP